MKEKILLEAIVFSPSLLKGCKPLKPSKILVKLPFDTFLNKFVYQSASSRGSLCAHRINPEF